MNDDDMADGEVILVNDHPTLETQLALVIQALNRISRRQARDGRMLGEVRDQVRTQNGNVATLTGRMNTHDQHHGKGDIHIAERLTGLDVADKITGHEGRLTLLEGPPHDADAVSKKDRERFGYVTGGAALVLAAYGLYQAAMEIFG